MEFINFTSIVREEVEKRTGENYKVRINDVRKNNGVILRGLTVTQDDINISPTIYLNDYYEDYTNGKATLVNVVNDVLDTYNRNRVNRSVDMKYFLNFECVKGKVVYKLINAEKNKELLEDIPYVKFLDLAIVFQCLISKEDLGTDTGTATILIHHAHLKLWDITIDELYKVAKENTQKLQKYEIKNMHDVICELTEAENSEDCDDMAEFESSISMYVLSNKSRVEGAACILYPELIKDFSNVIGSSLYIIPSSIHEVLLLPSDNLDECDAIKGMIKEINDSQVKIEEVLSYSLYFYDKQKRKIIRV